MIYILCFHEAGFNSTSYTCNIFIFLQQAATIAFKLKLQKHFDVTEVTTLLFKLTELSILTILDTAGWMGYFSRQKSKFKPFCFWIIKLSSYYFLGISLFWAFFHNVSFLRNVFLKIKVHCILSIESYWQSSRLS